MNETSLLVRALPACSVDEYQVRSAMRPHVLLLLYFYVQSTTMRTVWDWIATAT